MIIISHRGLWENPKEKNTEIAFRRSFENGFGIETDVRDCCGKLVISHDPPNGNELSFEEFIKIFINYDLGLTLALNIKSDGLHIKLKEILDSYNINNYFLFDMSIPDSIPYVNLGLRVFSRQSEFESVPSLYDKVEGIWMDEFYEHWINQDSINHHLQNHKKVCIVSPELHMREHLSVWESYKNIVPNLISKDIMFCTDFPRQANEFFKEG